MSKVTELERQQRREADREKSRAAVEALTSSEGWTAWLSSRRHVHTYSLANQLLVAMQCPTATRVAGFRAWLKLGYCVRRGETALRIWVPVPPSKRSLEAWRATGADPREMPRTHFKLGPVFDRSQVQELPPPALPVPLDPPIRNINGGDLAWTWPLVVGLAREIGSEVIVEAIPRGAGGFYVPETRSISINAANTVNHQVKTLVHELGHALLRAEVDVDDSPFSYSEEELVVESVAFTVCGSIGLDTSGYSIPYLASWSQTTSLDTIEQAARTIDRLAKRIEDAVTTRE